MATLLHTIFAIDYNGSLLDGIQSTGISAGIVPIGIGGDGQIYTVATAGLTGSPGMSFSTEAVATALAAIGTIGGVIDGDTLVTAYLQKLAEGSARAAGANHIKAVVNEGLIYPLRLTAGTAGKATIEYGIVATWNETADPIVFTTAQSLAGAPGNDEAFVMGPIKINGTQVESIVGVEIDFGIRLKVPNHDGTFWPREVVIMDITPSITFATEDPSVLSTFTLDGTAQGATASEIYLRALQPGGTRYANAGLNHIKIINTASKGMIRTNDITGAHGETYAASVSIDLASDGDTHPLTITTGVALPAGM